MNAPVRPEPVSPTRHKVTLLEFLRMWESGMFDGYPDMELIDGELIEMPADGPRTTDWNAAIAKALFRAPIDANLTIVPDKTFDLDDHFAPKPDFYIHDRPSVAQVNGRNVLLVIEVSDTTLPYDRDVKAPAYEKGGVREHWRIECAARRICVYRLGADGAYGEPAIVAFDETAEALLVPGLRLRLADLSGLT